MCYNYYVVNWTDTKRAAEHLPVGVLVAWALGHSPYLGVTMAVTFLTYEVAQDWRKHDQSFKDILGFLIGLSVGAFLF